MVFSSTVFLLAFLPVVLGVHFVLPRVARNAWLLAASLFFYAWGEGRVVVLLVASIVLNWGAGFLLTGRQGTPAGRLIVGLTVLADLGLLFAAKYLDFALSTAADLAASWGIEGPETIGIALPIGISFFTFQTISYVVDVERGVVPPERNIIRFATYVALFPQLVAGPIVRYRTLAVELVSRVVDRPGFAMGVRRFVIGLAKKMLVANTVSATADAAFGLPTVELTAAVAWAGLLAYGVQIYFDFSGYSDMAIGLGLMLGFRFPENFDYPYTAKTITEFWRRWHITLSSWFRDYLFIPLGGAGRGGLRASFNLGLVFLLCGLWHGASWTFAVWGLWHGVFLILERAGLAALVERLPAALARLYALAAVFAGWVLFRCESLTAAGGFGSALLGFGEGDPLVHDVRRWLQADVVLALGCGVLGSMPIVPWLASRWRIWSREGEGASALAIGGRGLATVGLLVLLLASTAQLAASTQNPFIYFRF